MLDAHGPHQVLGGGGYGLAWFLGLLPFPPTFGFVAPLRARTFSGIVSSPGTLWEVGVYQWMPRLGGVVWRPGLCLNRRSLITGIHPLQKPGNNGLPPTCCRRMKAFAESFELHGETH